MNRWLAYFLTVPSLVFGLGMAGCLFAPQIFGHVLFPNIDRPGRDGLYLLLLYGSLASAVLAIVMAVLARGNRWIMALPLIVNLAWIAFFVFTFGSFYIHQKFHPLHFENHVHFSE
jgi:hypothetical protein